MMLLRCDSCGEEHPGCVECAAEDGWLHVSAEEVGGHLCSFSCLAAWAMDHHVNEVAEP